MNQKALRNSGEPQCHCSRAPDPAQDRRRSWRQGNVSDLTCPGRQLNKSGSASLSSTQYKDTRMFAFWINGFCCIVAVYKTVSWVWYLTRSKIQKIITVHLRGHNVRGKVLIEYNSLNWITLPISTQCPFGSVRLSCWRSTATYANTEDSTAKGPKALNHSTARACLSAGPCLSPPGNTLPWEHRPGATVSHIFAGEAKLKTQLPKGLVGSPLR